MPLGDASSRQVAELQAQVERLSKTVAGLQGEISHLQGSRDDSRRDNGKLDISPLSQQDRALFDTPLGQSIHNPR
jgi:outer membrane murein-binding lipoprotein Lpp